MKLVYCILATDSCLCKQEMANTPLGVCLITYGTPCYGDLYYDNPEDQKNLKLWFALLVKQSAA